VHTGGDPVHDVHVHAGPDVTAPTYKSPKPLLSQLHGLVRRSGPLRRSSSGGGGGGDGCGCLWTSERQTREGVTGWTESEMG
jgi:hypothetical protein